LTLHLVTPPACEKGFETLDEFDEALLSAIDEIFRYTLGDVCTKIIYNYFERNSFPKHEIPTKLDRFSDELRKLLGDGKGQILGSAPILEEAIAERLCTKLGTKLQGRLPVAFSIFIRNLKEDYYSRGQEIAVSVIERTAKPEEAKMY
jgi:hypothetical protein